MILLMNMRPKLSNLLLKVQAIYEEFIDEYEGGMENIFDECRCQIEEFYCWM